MPPPDAVAEYLDALTRELSFDPPLARRVRLEVADHLLEAEATDPIAERFGSVTDIAGQYVALSASRQARRAGAVLVLVTVCMFATMYARLTWYAWLSWSLSGQGAVLGRIVFTIDRYAFMAAVAFSVIAWIHAVSRPIQARCDAGCRAQSRRAVALTIAAVCPLLACFATDAVMLAVRLSAWPSFTAAIPPVATIIAEAICAAWLIREARGVSLRASRVASLQAE